MGFNKRIVTKESILITEEDRLDTLFNADALIMDNWASKFINMYESGQTKEEIIKILEDESTES
jgi:hypothetical protein